MLVWMWIACTSSPCTSDLSARLDDATRVDSARRPIAAARALVDHCTLPPYVERALRDRVSAPAEAVDTIGAALATDRPDVWAAACPNGGSRAIIALGRTQNKGALYDTCNVERHGALTRDEMAQLEAPILTVIIAHYLRASGLGRTETRLATRLLGGLDH